MAAMQMRREANSRVRKSPLTSRRAASRRSAIGMTIWFETMVETAIAATITIDVADENPPRKARNTSSWRSSARGSVSTNKSGLAPSGITFSPTMAIGKMKMVIPSR